MEAERTEIHCLPEIPLSQKKKKKREVIKIEFKRAPKVYLKIASFQSLTSIFLLFQKPVSFLKKPLQAVTERWLCVPSVIHQTPTGYLFFIW